MTYPSGILRFILFGSKSTTDWARVLKENIIFMYCKTKGRYYFNFWNVNSRMEVLSAAGDKC